MQLINTQSIRKFHCNASISIDILAATITRCSIIASRAYSTRSHAPTAATPGCSRPSRGSNFLILDGWGLANVTAEQGRDVLEILDDRQGRGSTIVTSQVDVKHWHDMIANPTVADAILDRLVHNAHRLSLAGESLRKAAAERAALDAKASA
jgi:hypothetical protein